MFHRAPVFPRPVSSSTTPDEGYRLPGTTVTAVAVDRDKNSVQAVKWALDHLPINNSSIILLHVRTKTSNHGYIGAEGGHEASQEPMDREMSELFLPFKTICSRRVLHIREVVVDNADIPKGIIDYITANHIHNIAVGASNRNSFTRKFRNHDVPSCLIRAAPEFCAVYVISKGKPITVRSAKEPHINGLPPRQPPVMAIVHHMMDPKDAVKTPFTRRGGPKGLPPALLPERRSFERNTDYMKTPQLDRPLSTAKTAPSNLLVEGRDSANRPRRPSVGSRESFSEDMDFQGSLSSAETGDSSEFSYLPNEITSPISGSQRDLEAEMRRLKLELKQTMDMYSTACKEAITAKQKAQELHQWKMEEARKFEEARHAEEAALAMAKMEKAKCKAAIEAAEAAQKIAELEAKKRFNAEMKAKREAEEKRKALDALAHNDVRYRKYTIDEIEIATNYFAESLKIGEGGYGPVFKASLDHTPVAIKVLRPDAAQGRKQFHQEIEVLSCIRHPNMVLLLGACPEYGCLVYEYMDNGSLEDRLFRRGNTPTIPWTVRFKIAAEIATALLFLHQTKPEPLVHRDLKPANILLDHNYVSKISDVGLSRLVPPSVADSVTQYHMTSAAGTFYYIDPEYQQTGMLGIKSDIYSLGVMLLQIVTARPPMGLTHHVEKAIDRGTFTELLDHTVTEWPVEDVLTYAKLALKCTELRKKDRPNLGTVILPELNRLRNLAIAHEAKREDNDVDVVPPAMNTGHQRSQSHTGQERVTSNGDMATPWKSTTDAVQGYCVPE